MWRTCICGYVPLSLCILNMGTASRWLAKGVVLATGVSLPFYVDKTIRVENRSFHLDLISAPSV